MNIPEALVIASPEEGTLSAVIGFRVWWGASAPGPPLADSTVLARAGQPGAIIVLVPVMRNTYRGRGYVQCLTSSPQNLCEVSTIIIHMAQQGPRRIRKLKLVDPRTTPRKPWTWNLNEACPTLGYGEKSPALRLKSLQLKFPYL